MPQGKYLSLEEGRSAGMLEQFANRQPSEEGSAPILKLAGTT